MINIWFWCLFITLQRCRAQLKEGICVRDSAELTKMFEGKKTMKVATYDTPRREENAFIEMIQHSTVFVDKSLLIKKIVDTENTVVVIHAPSRSGKTTNLNMMKSFFEIRVNNIGDMRSISRTSTNKFFNLGRMNSARDRPLHPMRHYTTPRPNESSIGDGLKEDRTGESVQLTYVKPPLISKRKSVMRRFLGQYPLIYLELRRDPDHFGRRSNPFINSICCFFQRDRFLSPLLYSRAHYENTSLEIKQTLLQHQRRFESYYNKCSNHDLNYTEAVRSIVHVSEIMFDLFDKQMIILIDDYAALLEDDLIRNNRNSTEIEAHIEQMRYFMKTALADNPYLLKAVLTDTLCIHRKRVFSDVHFIESYNVVDDDLQQFYGFTENEVNLLFQYFEVPAAIAQKARTYYNGYTIKRNSTVILYNMQSVGEFFSQIAIHEYWIRKMRRPKSDSEYWLDFANLSEILQPLLDGGRSTISFTEVDLNSEVSQIFVHSGHSNQVFKPTKKTLDGILSLLLQIGFFTIAGYGSPSNKTCDEIEIRIPNEEINTGLREILGNSSMVLQPW